MLQKAKRGLSLLLVCCILLTLMPIQAVAYEAAATEAVQPRQTGATPPALVRDIFPDPALASEIVSMLGDGIVTQEDLDQIIGIAASHRNIVNLEGVQYLQNLVHLFVDGNRIRDISPLAKLTNLTSLYLADNRWIQDISALSGLDRLQTLLLSQNQIQDISPLARLSSLKYLRLGSNQIYNLQPLQNLTNLTTLDVGDQAVMLPATENINPLRIRNIISLPEGIQAEVRVGDYGRYETPYVVWPRISEDATHVTYRVNDFFSIGELNVYIHILVTQPLTPRQIDPTLPTLSTPTRVRDVFPDPSLALAMAYYFGTINQHITQEDLDGLTTLELVGMDIRDLEGLQYLRNLRSLFLDHNRISDIGPLAYLRRLDTLGLSGNRISDIGPLAYAANVYNVNLHGNQIYDLSPLAEMGLLGADIREQRIVFPAIPLETPMVKENMLTSLDGTSIAPATITHGGRYRAPNITWAEVEAGTTQLRYTFNVAVPNGLHGTIPFSGTVVQLLEHAFDDVSFENWFNNYVQFVFENNLMQGTSATRFLPFEELSRAMVVTILYRLAGQPDVEFQPIFHDVAEGRWYTDAVIWAAENSIVEGVGGGRFAPNASISREQFAAMLYRFVGAPELEDDAMDFVDQDEVSAWAITAMTWATGNGLITGMPGNLLAPAGVSNRAQCAAILMRLDRVVTVAERD